MDYFNNTTATLAGGDCKNQDSVASHEHSINPKTVREETN